MTGGADGKLLLWEDQSEELRQKRQREQARRVEVQQTLDNLVQQDRHLEALLIALDLNQPFQWELFFYWKLMKLNNKFIF